MDWVFDSLVQFLSTDAWRAPIAAFLDHESIVFDADVDDAHVDALFAEYVRLIDALLTRHCQELGISEEQFSQALDASTHQLSPALRQLLFTQIRAAEERDAFVQMMRETNISLQMQTLSLLAQRGVVYDSFKDAFDFERDTARALARSLDDEVEVKAREKNDETEKEETIELARASNITEPRAEETKQLATEVATEVEKEVTTEARTEPTEALPLSRVPPPSDVALRSEYFRAQRDKIVAKKHKAKKTETDSQQPHVPEFRRALASRLKHELSKK